MNPLKTYRVKWRGRTKARNLKVKGEVEVKATKKEAAVSLAKLMYPTIDFEAIEAYKAEKQNDENRK